MWTDRQQKTATLLRSPRPAQAIAAQDAEDLILEAIERVELRMGGTLGDDGMITYAASAGEESQEGKLLMDELISRFGALATESPAQ